MNSAASSQRGKARVKPILRPRQVNTAREIEFHLRDRHASASPLTRSPHLQIIIHHRKNIYVTAELTQLPVNYVLPSCQRYYPILHFQLICFPFLSCAVALPKIVLLINKSIFTGVSIQRWMGNANAAGNT